MRKLNDRKKCNKAETSKTAEQDTDKYFRLRLSKKSYAAPSKFCNFFAYQTESSLSSPLKKISLYE